MMWENEAFVEKPCGIKAVLEGVSLLWSQHITSPDVRARQLTPTGGRRPAGAAPFRMLR
jgi:hypothetical protein